MLRWRLSARLSLTLLTTAMTLLAVVLIVGVVRQAVSDSAPGAATVAADAAWTLGIIIAIITASATWFITGALVRPLHELRRDLALSLRSRALAESSAHEVPEVRALRTAMLAVLLEMEARSRTAESEQRRLLNLFETITEGILQVDSDARILHANAAARMLLNLPANAEGQTAAALIRHLELREIVERAARGEASAATEVVLDTRQLLVTPHRLRSLQPQGTGGSVITIVNLTELRRLESVRRDFVANVSHELKTPLTSIRGYAETLISDDMPRDIQLQFLEVIRKNASRIQRIVDELLDLSRLQSGGWQPDLQTVEVSELVRDVWSACDEFARKKDVRFEVSGAPAMVVADPGGLRQVFSNLFENALRYTSAGGSVNVRLGTPDPKGYVKVEITDTGIGIPRDALPRIFERFFRVDPARSREQGGTGLGLSIVKHLVERMSGEVTAESELGRGTTINLRLRAAKAENERIIT